MIKILFCSKVGLELKNSTGGQQLRVKTSIETLSQLCDLKIISRNIRFKNNKKPNYLKNKKFLLAPSAKKTIKKNFIKSIVWRLREFYYLEKDAQFLINLYRKHNCSCIWISFASTAYNLTEKIKKIDPSIKIISDTEAVFHKFLERRIPYENIFLKLFLYFKCKYLKRVEKKMLINSEIVSAVSNYDKKIFKSIYSKSKIMIFRNGVKETKIKKTKHKGFNILITGSFGDKNSPMNVSTRWFIDKIYPKIKTKIKNLKIYIVGIDSTREFKNQEQIIVKDWVLDITKYFSISDILAVPLKYESGTRFKILEAGMFDLPVVSTQLGAEGLNYKNNKSILIANDARKFAKKIIYFYKNPKMRKKFAINNRKLVVSNYSIKSMKKDALKILREIN